ALLPPLSARPLRWLGVYDAPEIFDRAATADWLAARVEGAPARVADIDFSMWRGDDETAFRRVTEYIAPGDVYQINLTMLARFRLDGDPVALYRDLCRKQPVAHGALIATGNETVLSLSPEPFIERRGGKITTRPMKGTIRRGRN